MLSGLWFLSANLPIIANAAEAPFNKIKSFMDASPPVEKIVFEQGASMEGNSTSRFEAAWGSKGFVISYLGGRRIENGLFEGVPWSYSDGGIESITFYETNTEDLKRQIQATGGITAEEAVIRTVLNYGIFALKPGTLRWLPETHKFQGIIYENRAISGYLTNFNSEQLPLTLYYTTREQRSYEVSFRFGGEEIPRYFPTVMERVRVTDGEKTLIDRYKINKLIVSSGPLEPDLLNPLIRHPDATRFYHTNDNWRGIEGTNEVHVSRGSAGQSYNLRRILFAALVICAVLLLYLRFRRIFHARRET